MALCKQSLPLGYEFPLQDRGPANGHAEAAQNAVEVDREDADEHGRLMVPKGDGLQAETLAALSRLAKLEAFDASTTVDLLYLLSLSKRLARAAERARRVQSR